METIKFKDRDYPIRNLYMPFGIRTISIVELNEVFMDVHGNYICDEAQQVDEEIFYFVENRFFNLNEKDLVSKIISEI